jgi:hypothetical protein
VPEGFEPRFAALQGGGRPLSDSDRAFFEPRFGRDLSAVRIHDDAQAAASARAVDALAYTFGNDIVMRSAPTSSHADRRLLAHELTHTIQQENGAAHAQMAPAGVGDANDRAEADADATASAVLNKGLVADEEPHVAPDPVLRRQQPPQPAQPVPPTLPTVPTNPGATLPPTTSAPICPISATNPGTCSGRHGTYCAAGLCFPSDPWLGCACRASGEVCDAIDAFSFTGVNGFLLAACINTPVANPYAMAAAGAKAGWLLGTNSCIWNHWRAAFEALHNPALPIPSGLTAEWNTAVTTCRTSGAGSKACCNAQVVAEQNAIDRCGPYNSRAFGKSPYDIPGAPVCSAIVRALAPPPLFPSSSDFGVVADRISYGQARCCP